MGIPSEDCSLLEKIQNDFASTNYLWIAVIVFSFMISNVFRALRWQMLLEPIGAKVRFSNAFMATMIGYFANLGLPRMGEVIKAGLLSKYENVEIEKVFGTVVTDRIMDLILFGVMIFLALAVEYDTLWGFLSNEMSLGDKFGFIFDHPLMLILGTIIILAGVVVLFKSEKVKSSRLAIKAKKLISGFFEGVMSIFKLKNPWLFIFYSVGIWALYFTMTFTCFYAFEPTAHLGPREGLLVFVFGTLGILVPTPGGLGAYQYLIKEALMIYGIGSADAFSFSNIIYFSIQILGNILFGVISLIMMPIWNKKK